MMRERHADLGTAAGRDLHVLEPVALLVAGNALHPVLAGWQVLGLELALLAAHHHEGEAALVVLQLHEGTGDGLAIGIVDDALDGAALLRDGNRWRGKEDGGSPGSQNRADGLAFHKLLPRALPSILHR